MQLYGIENMLLDQTRVLNRMFIKELITQIVLMIISKVTGLIFYNLKLHQWSFILKLIYLFKYYTSLGTMNVYYFKKVK